jgi:hypothetical protein
MPFASGNHTYGVRDFSPAFDGEIYFAAPFAAGRPGRANVPGAKRDTLSLGV